MLIVVSFMLSACSSGSGGNTNEINENASKEPETAPGEKVTITYWNMFGGGDGVIMNNLVKKFNDEHKDQIEVKALTQDWGQFYTKLQTAVAGGNAPDLAISHTSKLSELVDLGIIEPLDPYIDSMGIDISGFNENMLNATLFDGQQYDCRLMLTHSSCITTKKYCVS